MAAIFWSGGGLVMAGAVLLACGAAPAQPVVATKAPVCATQESAPVDDAAARDAAQRLAEQGHEMLELGKVGDRKMFEQAKAPLRGCVEKDPTRADCYDALGYAEELTDNEQTAAQDYLRAIERDPLRVAPYQHLAELYASFRRDAEAEQVLREGLRLVPASPENGAARFSMFAMQARLARRRQDGASELQALDSANALIEFAPYDQLVPLAVSYLSPESPEALSEVRKRTAITILVRLDARICREERARLSRAAADCDTVRSLLQRLGQ